MNFRSLVLFFALSFLGLVAYSQTYTVTNNADSGAGSLRQGITQANSGSYSLIQFNISGSTTIQPSSADLPTITKAGLVIDGTTQPGTASYEIILNGNNTRATGFTIAAANVTIKGFEIKNFTTSGIRTRTSNTSVNLNKIVNNGKGVELGDGTTGATGCTIQTNLIENNTGAGIALIGSNSNTISSNTILNCSIGISAANSDLNTIQSNTIGNNANAGMELTSSSDNNIIKSNYVGSTSTFAGLPNTKGIYIAGSTGNTIGGALSADGNYVNYNTGNGITLYGGSTTNIVRNNFVGTNGSNDNMPNTGNGIEVFGSSTSNTIHDNTVCFNGGDGIRISSGSGSNSIKGNKVGSNSSGLDMGNAGHGLIITTTSHNNTVGGTTSAESNIFSGNGGNGIHIEGCTTNTVLGNYIGTNPAFVNIGNNGHGIRLQSGSPNNTIGGSAANYIAFNTMDGISLVQGADNTIIKRNYIGTNTLSADMGNGGRGIYLEHLMGVQIGGSAAGEPNTISFNKSYGIYLLGGSGNKISRNPIFNNKGWGIEFDPGYTTNTNKVPPLVVSKSVSGNNITVRYNAPSTDVVEVFKSDAGRKNANTYLGNATYNSGSGLWEYTTTVPNPLDPHYFVASATSTSNNSSKFGLEAFIVTNPEESGPGSFRDAIAQANYYPDHSQIFFDITDPVFGTAPFTIPVSTYLPTLIHGFEIDASTQPGTGPYKIVLQGASGVTQGLNINNPAATKTSLVKGLHIKGFSNGLFISGMGASLLIKENKISDNNNGISLSSTLSTAIVSNEIINNAAVGVNASIVDTIKVTNNTISGNGSHGIMMVRVNNSFIKGNKIGTDASGNNAMPNMGDGIQGNFSGPSIIGGGGANEYNIISFNKGNGINMPDRMNIIVKGNYIGTNPSFQNQGNELTGIIKGTSVSAVIGGAGANEGNYIGFNKNHGININGSGTTTILGNYIGTNAAGLDMGNLLNGIRGTSGEAVIGGASAGEGNVIGLNKSDGIYSSIFATSIKGNYIGIGKTGGNIGNGGNGITLTANANTIGGTAANEYNTIANNGGDGVSITGINNRLYNNIIKNNGDKSIDLNITSPTPGNNSKVTPVISSKTQAGNVVTLQITNQAGDVVQVFVGDASRENCLQYLGNATYNATTQKYTYNHTVTGGGPFYYAVTATNTNNNTSEVGYESSLCLVVNNTSDSGPGSLREAINCANANPDASIITFNIPGNGPHIITPVTPLPPISYPATLDATTQPGTSTYKVTLDGTASPSSYGFTIYWPNVTIKGFEIKNWDTGIMLAKGDALVSSNLISNNTTGISFSGAPVPGGVISNCTVENNVIGNNTYGIATVFSHLTNIIRANYIGVNTSFASLPNETGIYIGYSSSGVLIGGSNPADANYICSNSGSGITTYVSNAIIKGNYIGTNASYVDLGNGESGISISSGSSGNTVGGTSANDGNVICFNGNSGISIGSGGSENNIIYGNFIGTDKTGALDLGNLEHGVSIETEENFACINNVIGGAGAGMGNTIAYNKLNGVHLKNAPNTGEKISGNKIYSNNRKQISLNMVNGANGANNSKPYPTITAKNHVGNTVTLTITSQTGDVVEVFRSDASGQNCFQYLGTATYNSGNATWSFVTTVAGAGPHYFGATATDANNNTSEIGTELGSCLMVTNTNNDGPGSLRQAIECANAAPDHSVITFNIIGSSDYTIRPLTQLPAIVYPITVDATTQAGSATYKIILDGVNGGDLPFQRGFDLAAGATGSTIKGMEIRKFVSGIYSVSHSTTIQGNKIVYNNSNGIYLTGNNHVVTGNIISNTSAQAIYLYQTENASITNNTMSDNGAGMYLNASNQNITGNTITNNSWGGIVQYNGFTASSYTNIIDNTISGNTNFGVQITGVTNVTIKGNKIGVDAAGTAAMPNTTNGIYTNFVSNAVIGGAAPGEPNIIAGNGLHGIYIGPWCTATITSNFIGTNGSGLNLGNEGDGIRIETSFYTVTGNTVGFNKQNGINGYGYQTGTRIIRGNFIGTNAGGQNIGNLSHGINLATNGNIVGGIGAGQANTIANNGGDGVHITQTGSSGFGSSQNFISANIIKNNADKGIDLDLAGTPGNNSKAVPVIGFGNISTSGILTLQGTAGAGNRVELFVSDAAGKNANTYMGAVTAAGNGTWSYPVPSAYFNISNDNFYIATATDQNAAPNNNNTSEFSSVYAVRPVCIVTNTNDSGPGSLREAIICANAMNKFADIKFQIPASGPYVINILSALPALTNPNGIKIDGSSQTQFCSFNPTLCTFNGTPLITINTAVAGLTAFNITDADNSEIRNLRITNFETAINVDAVNVKVSGCEINAPALIGINVNGQAEHTHISGNTITNFGNGTGIMIIGANTVVENRNVILNTAQTGIGIRVSCLYGPTTIGMASPTAATLNIIGGCDRGISIDFSQNVNIYGNLVGGTSKLNSAAGCSTGPNYGGKNNYGIYAGHYTNYINIGSSSATNDDYSNIIFGNVSNINIDGNYSGIYRNYIGIDKYACGALVQSPNPQQYGITLTGNGNSISNNNIICNHTVRGISLTGGSSIYVYIDGNKIGTNQAGNTGIGNAVGIYADASAGIVNNQISGNTQQSIILRPNAWYSYVYGNTIGANSAGTALLANTSGVDVYAPYASFTGNQFAGGQYGIKILGTNSAYIYNNKFGVNAAGTAKLAITGHGIEVNGTGSPLVPSSNITISGNVISGCGGNGIYLRACDAVSIMSNKIGVNALGTAAIANDKDGIFMYTMENISGTNYPNNISIGNMYQENTISGNGTGSNSGHGINVSGQTIFINNNFIGSNSSGTAPIGNKDHGINIVSGSGIYVNSNQISGNKDGIRIGAGNDIDFAIMSNTIGVPKHLLNNTNYTALRNTQNGITILSVNNSSNSFDDMIHSNMIYRNGFHGVFVSGSNFNKITQNEIYNNNSVSGSYKDISLNLTGTPGNQSKPIPTFVTPVKESTVGAGMVTLTAQANDEIELFQVNNNDNTLTYLNTVTVPAGGGNVNFTGLTLGTGTKFLATARNTSRSTSEYSTFTTPACPHAAFNYATATSCTGGTLIFQNQVAGGISGTTIYKWEVDGVVQRNNTSASDFTHTFTAGSHTVKLTATNSQCYSEYEESIEIEPTEGVSAGKDLVVCKTDQITLQATSGFASYSWSPATSLSATNVPNPVLNAATLAPGTESVTYTVTATSSNGCISNDQVTITVLNADLINKYIGYSPSEPSNSYPNHLKELGDHNFMFFSSDKVAKISPKGNTIWQISPKWLVPFSGGWMAMADVAGDASPDGHSIISAKAGSGTTIIKLDPNGNELLRKRYDNPNEFYVEINKLKITSDGGCILAGRFGDNFGSPVVIMKLNSTLDVVWAKTYSELATVTDIIEVAAGGEYVLLGGPNYDSSTEYVYLHKINSTGGNAWTYPRKLTMSIYLESGYNVPGGLTETASGDIIVSGTYYDNNYIRYPMPYLVKLSAATGLNSTQRLLTLPATMIDGTNISLTNLGARGLSVKEVSGNIVLTGQFITSMMGWGGHGFPFVATFDQNLNNISGKPAKLYYEDQIARNYAGIAMEKTSKNDLVLMVGSDYPSTSGFRFMRMTKEGILGCSEQDFSFTNAFVSTQFSNGPEYNMIIGNKTLITTNTTINVTLPASPVNVTEVCSKICSCELTASISSSNGSNYICAGGPAVTLTANTNETGTFTYLWSTGATTQNINVTAPGIYTVTIKKTGSSCEGTAVSSMTQIPYPVAQFNVAPACANSNVVLSGVTTNPGSYTYDWNFAGTQVSNNSAPAYSFPTAGSHNITLTVSNHGVCANAITKPVTINPLPAVSSIQALGVSCTGVSDGQVKFTIGTVTGISSYNYSVGSATASGVSPGIKTVNGLGQGSFNIVVQDADPTKACSVDYPVSVGYGGPQITDLCVGNVSCSAPTVTSGKIEFKLQRSNPAAASNFAYNLKSGASVVKTGSGTFNSLTTISGIAAGTYTLEAIPSDNGCLDAVVHNISVAPPNLSVALANDELSDGIYYTCGNGQNQSNVSITVTPGTSACTNIMNYTYRLYNTAVTPHVPVGSPATVNTATRTFSNLPTGIYSVEVTMAINGGTCTRAIPFEVRESSVFAINLTTTGETCTGSNNGTALANVAGGGLDPLTYTWFNGSTQLDYLGSQVSDLAPGTNYIVKVQDGRGCIKEQNFVIAAAPVLNVPDVNLVPNTCGASATISGGTAPYSFTWIRQTPGSRKVLNSFNSTTGAYTLQNESFTVEESVFIETPENNGTTSIPTVTLKPGTYSVRVTDANGCISVSEPAVLAAPNVTRTYDLCIRWKTPDPVNDEPPVTVIPTINGQTIAATNMITAIEEKTEQCIKKQTEKISADFNSLCFTGDNLNDQLDITYNIKQHHYTLYYYDRMQQLVRTVPPKGVDASATNRNVVPLRHSFVTSYDYNSLGQLTKQNTPDGGVSNFLYNDLGQLRFSQNARQADTDPLENPDGMTRFSYTKYDPLGRIVEVGESKLNTDFGATLNVPSTLSDNTHPASNTQQETFSVYNQPATWINYFGKGQRYLQNRISYTYTKNWNGSKSYTYYSYDPHGNVEWVVQDVPGLSKAYTAYEYDLISNKVLKVKYNEKLSDKFFHRYNYDEDNRILSFETSPDGYFWDKDAVYNYYAHGPLRRTGLGEDNLQKLDMTYTINGWLKAINSPELSVNSAEGPDKLYAQDEYSMVLGYHGNDFTRAGSAFNSATGVHRLNSNKPLYNGNITSWVSRVNKEYQDNKLNSTQAEYDRFTTGMLFTYDRLNRLKSGTFQRFNGLNYTAQTDYFSSYSYDANGNITALTRRGYASGSTSLNMDNLIYNYTAGTNQLTHVDDNPAYTSNYTVDVDDQNPGNYTYDKTGNLRKDLEEEIKEIKWNAYGKVSEVIPVYNSDPVKQKKAMRFEYDASGNRIRKEVNSAPYANSTTLQRLPEEITTTYYVRDASGNAMAVYERKNTPLAGNPGYYTAEYKVIEQSLYGSERVGMFLPDQVVASKVFKGTEMDMTDFEIDIFNRKAENKNMILASKKEDAITLTGQPGLNINSASAHRITYISDGTPYQKIDLAFLGTAGKGVAMAEDHNGVAEFHVIATEEYWGAGNVCLVYDKVGNLMPGSDGIKADGKSQPVIIKKPGNNKLYYIVTRGADGTLYYTTVDMDQAGNGSAGNKYGTVTGTINMPLDQAGNTNYGRNMQVIEDYVTGKATLIATRFTPSTTPGQMGTTELVSFEIDDRAVLLQYADVMKSISSSDEKGMSELLVSPDGSRLSFFNNKKHLGWFDHHTTDVTVFHLGHDHKITEQVDAAPTISASVQNGNYAASSAEFSKDGRYLYFGQKQLAATPLAGATTSTDKAIWKYDLKTNTRSAVDETRSGGIRRGMDQRMYVVTKEGLTINGYKQDQFGVVTPEPAKNITFTNTLAGYISTQPHRIYSIPVASESILARTVDKKQYELKDHLGNVTVVFSDRKGAVLDGSLNLTNIADVKSYSNYYPYGMLMPGRSDQSGYRYGFNGMEKDDELKGEGNSYDFGARIYDPRLGRFLSVDRFFDKNPTYSPYVYADDNPIIFIDLNGDFRMSARMQRKYPQLTNLLKNIQQTVHNDPKTYQAFKETLGITDEEADAILQWGKGPKVKVGATPGAYANTSVKRVKVWGKLIRQLEGQKESGLTKEGLIYLVYMTVLHEGQHAIENMYKKTLRQADEVYEEDNLVNEAGLVFEQKATGQVVEYSNADELQKQNLQERREATKESQDYFDGGTNIEMIGKGKMQPPPFASDKEHSENLGINKDVIK